MQKEIAIIKSDAEGLRKTIIDVAEEIACTITVDGESMCLHCSPGYLPELAVGFLAGQGAIKSRRDIAKLESDENSVNILLKDGREGQDACAVGIIGQSPFTLEPHEVQVKLAAFHLSTESIKAAMEEFIGLSATYKKTRGVHSIAVGHGERRLFWVEDVARFNAYNKAMGYCILQDLDMQDKCILLSGRVSAEMVKQAHHAGIKLLIAKASPLSQAVDWARLLNIGLIGLVQGGNCNIYHL